MTCLRSDNLWGLCRDVLIPSVSFFFLDTEQPGDKWRGRGARLQNSPWAEGGTDREAPQGLLGGACSQSSRPG